VHRDIKPSNLMFVREDGGDFTVKVIDFGLAKSSAGGEDSATLTSGGFLGTPHFASPEQLEEREIDVRSDIYSLGVTLWYMLAGKTPFSGSLAQVMSQHLHRVPPFELLEGQPASLIRLLGRMMEKDPAKRPQTPLELRQEIEACAGDLENGIAGAGPVTGGEIFETSALPEGAEGSAVELASDIVLAERYRLLDEVTASDHGRMFRAERLEDRATVAVLVAHSGRLTTSEAFTRLEQEVESLQRLPHPAFQKILSLESASYHTFLVLEWIEGTPLLDVLRSRRALPVREAVVLLGPLAEAFDQLSEAELGCPDIAVHEILLQGGDLAQPKFLPLTGTGVRTLAPDATMVASSFAMMKASGAFAGNPENAFVFAVASLAYEMLGGVRTGSSVGSYVPIPGLSEDGNAALRKALNPAQSYDNARVLVAELAKAAPASGPLPVASLRELAPVRQAASGVLRPPPLPERKKGRPVLPWVLAGAAVFLAVGGFVAWRGMILLKRLEPVPLLGRNEPTPVPEASATPEPPPTPDPQREAYETGLAAARELQQKDDLGGGLAAYARLATEFPGENEPLVAMENLAANVRARSAKISPADLAVLREPLEQAAARNVRSAQMVLGEMLRKSDPAEALKWFLAAGDQGQTEAMVYAGEMMARGRGLAGPDLPGAVGWFSKASDLGDPEGMYALAECYFFGKGIAKDPKRAVELLTTAAGLNNPRAMNMLGDLVYRKGVPGLVEPNEAESFRLISKAKEMGFLDAQGNLGVLYMNGQGVAKDPKMAVELFRDGAEKNNPPCMFFYAMCLEGGVVVDKDSVQSRDWYVRAAQAGNRPAIDWCKKNNIPLANTP
jgi:TPR repeat protein